MILCVDAGNTTIKIALVDRGRVVRRATASDGSARAIDAAMRRVLGRHGDLQGGALSSVNPSVTARLRRAIRTATGADPVIVSHRTPLPIAVRVRRAHTLGADRLCAAVGALGGARRHAIVVDVGTAVTVDIVVDRVFRGGAIMPGPAMALAALHAFTAALPVVDLRRLQDRLAFDRTDRAMLSGALLSAAGGVQAAAAALASRHGVRPRVVLTGGGARQIRRWLPSGWSFDPDLTLRGLDRIARYRPPTGRRR